MSKFLGRVGTTPCKYQFALVFDKLELSKSVNCVVCAEWVRGAKSAVSVDCVLRDGRCQWDQKEQMAKPCLMIVTLFKNKGRALSFQKKKSTIVIKQKTAQGNKTVGKVNIDLADYASLKEKASNVRLKLEKCSDKKAYLSFQVHSRFMGNATADEHSTMSRMDGMDSIASYVDGDEIASFADAPSRRASTDAAGAGGAGSRRGSAVMMRRGSTAKPIAAKATKDGELKEFGSVKEGTLRKADAKGKNWNKRYWVLTQKALSYYKNKKDAKPAGVIQLDMGAEVAGIAKDDPSGLHGKPLWFGVTPMQLTQGVLFRSKRTYYIQAKDDQELAEWRTAIQGVVDKNKASKPRAPSKPRPPSKPQPPGARPPQRTREEEWEAEQHKQAKAGGSGSATTLDPTTLANPFENGGSASASPENFGATDAGGSSPLQTFALDSDFSSDDENGNDGAGGGGDDDDDTHVAAAEPSLEISISLEKDGAHDDEAAVAVATAATVATPARPGDVSHVSCKDREKELIARVAKLEQLERATRRKAKAQRAQCLAQIEALTRQNKQLKESTRRVQDSAGEARQETEERLAEAQAAHHRAAARVKELEDEQAEAEQSAATTKKEFTRILEELESKEGEAKARVGELEHKLAEATGRIAGLEVDVQTQQGMVRALRREKDDVAAQLKGAQDVTAQLKARQESFRKMYDDGSEEMAKKRPKKLALAMAQIEYYENELQNADASMEGMKAALEDTSRIMMKDIQDLEEQIREQKKLYSESVEKEASWELAVAKAEERAQQAETDRGKLSKAVNGLEVRFAQSQAELRKLQAETPKVTSSPALNPFSGSGLLEDEPSHGW